MKAIVYEEYEQAQSVEKTCAGYLLHPLGYPCIDRISFYKNTI
jgi:hypothetical protein